MKFFLPALVLFFGCAHTPSKKWMEQSDKLSAEFSQSLGERYPESASSLGFNQFDSKGMLFDNSFEEKNKTFFNNWLSKVDLELQRATEGEFKTDLLIFREYIELEKESIKIADQNKDIDFFPGSKFIYMSLQELINDQSPPERKRAAVDRFKMYVNGQNNFLPLLEAKEDFFEYQNKKFKNAPKIFHYQKEVQLYLDETKDYKLGIKELLSISGRNDWKDDFQKFEKQLTKYDLFVKNKLLPKSRKTFRLPRNEYIHSLKSGGFKVEPEELIRMGEEGYKKLYREFAQLAANLAKKYGLKENDPAFVIRYFKKAQVESAKDIEKLYLGVNDRLTKIIEQESLVTLPKEPLKIRMAGEAESKAGPIPHVKTPPLINNHGERPEFVIPTSKNKMAFDDFSHPYIAITLTAHEGRPGHDLQFSKMLDKGVSLIRGHYAFNSVNVEGWALYAEDLIFPFISDEEKLFALQTRLWRMARAFLDPKLQLGMIKGPKAMEVLTQELGLSKEMAELELRRYTFDLPGQAPSYYYGYLIVKKMHSDALKKKFTQKCFNDQLLSYGLLPLSIIAERMKTDLKCE